MTTPSDESELQEYYERLSANRVSVFEKLLEETDKVAQRLKEELDKVPGVYFLFDTLNGMIFGCGQQLIDYMGITGNPTPLHDAIVYACSRLGTEAVAIYRLAYSGLVLPGSVVFRGATENVMQALAFMDRPSLAADWFAGKRLTPAKARDASPAAAALYNALYNKLSEVAHPRVAALVMHTVPLDAPQPKGVALAYGGWYAPRTAGILACEFLRIELAFLRSFYSQFQSELSAHGLLFLPGTTAEFERSGHKGSSPPIDWQMLLNLYDGMLAAAEEEIAALPPDQDEVAPFVKNIRM